ncbi:MAG: glycosyltransferase [Halobacteriota archaeon]
MKILQVLPHFSHRPLSLGSGVVHVVYYISNELARRGHEVTICTSSACDIIGRRQIHGFSNPVMLDDVKIDYFPFRVSFDHFYLTPKLIPFIRDHINDFDIAHLHDIRCFQSFVVYHYAMKHALPYVLQPHGSYLGSFDGSKLKWMLDSLLSSRVLKHANRIITLTKTEAEYYRTHGISAKQIDIIDNGVDLFRYQSTSRSGEFRKKFSIREEDRIILYVGRIASTKGLDFLVDAFSELLHELGNVKLVLVGPDAGYVRKLQQQINDLHIQEGVLFTGPIDETDKIRAYVDADVLVTPSYTGFPLTFLEACACGTPIIATHKGDALDWIDENVGYVINYNRTDLNKAITRILFDQDLKAKFKTNCRRLVEDRFAWPNIVDRIEEVYRRAVCE